MAGRQMKNCFFLFLGQSILILLLIIYISENLKKKKPPTTRISYMEFNINDSKQEINTKFIIHNLKMNATDISFNNKYAEHLALDHEKKDWHDYEAIKASFLRTGLGELGLPASLVKDPLGKVAAAINESYYNYGINGYLSDHISVNRSIPDYRAEICKSTEYLVNLPTVSIIIPFKDECLSVVLRGLHSIINRTPPELLEEIILIDDNSTLDNLKMELEKYVNVYLPKVKLIRLSETHGIMKARLVGAKQAKSKILVIFDAHIEVGYNWLPPLIEPIVLNNKTCTCPYIDRIDAASMRYAPVAGFRGAFDWQFYYHRLPLLSPNDETLPHLNPVMRGGLFAIGAAFFWELGGYDNELQIWGGEQYELSFKIWMCGGTLLDIPCSRVGHIGQISTPIRYIGMGNGVAFRNYMRIAEVWMDDYKKYIYEYIPEHFQNISIGDISTPKAIREKLQCKSFEWYLKEIAFDSLQHYPLEDPAAYALGTIRSIGDPDLCIAMKSNLILMVLTCAGDKNVNKKKEQTWLFTENGEIRKKGETECLDAAIHKPYVFVLGCHGLEGNQKWHHNESTKMIIHIATKKCLEVPKLEKRLFLSECDESNDNLRWEFSWYNETMSQSE